MPDHSRNPRPDDAQARWDAIIIGAGAAGLMTALTAAGKGSRVLVLDHAKKPAEKIRISGGGRCNFTNLDSTERNFLSRNPRFCRAALRAFPPRAFLAMVEAHRIAWHEKTDGQLFCDDSAGQIITMLLDALKNGGGQLWLGTEVTSITHREDGFHLATSKGALASRALVIATGGKSIPKIGATGFGYEIARQFGLDVIPTRPGLVPLTFSEADKAWSMPLSGLSVDATVKLGKTSFREGLLFTHRGLSGPSILQISSYWREGQSLTVDLAPDGSAFEALREARTVHPKQDIATGLATILPKRLAKAICDRLGLVGHMAEQGDKALRRLDEATHRWSVTPIGTEGYRTAEVTLGGVDTKGLSPQTMEAKTSPGLYCVGEVVDVTGHLGGHNFQWAWASGHAAGTAIAQSA